jgi:hypothetical protein
MDTDRKQIAGLVATSKQMRLVRERDFLAEVEVEMFDEETELDRGWGPYLLPGDVKRLDDVRTALRKKDLQTAIRLARVYQLVPVSAA